MTAPDPGFIFLDTNILVYALDRSAGEKHVRASNLVDDCWLNERGCLSIQVLQELYVTLTRKVTPPVDHLLAQQIIADFGQWRIHSPGLADLLQAVETQHAFLLSFWDAMVIQSAARLGAQILYSEDMAHGMVVGGVKIINPFK